MIKLDLESKIQVHKNEHQLLPNPKKITSIKVMLFLCDSIVTSVDDNKPFGEVPYL